MNLSDLAAKGADPLQFSLALGLAENWDETWIKGFARGLAHDCDQYGVTLNGGDTFRTGAGWIVSITALGSIPRHQYVSRLGARNDDVLFVTGTVGDGALGLLCHQEKIKTTAVHRDYLTKRYLLPEPRVSAAGLVRGYATASMDISDGLVGDAEKLAHASQCGLRIEIGSVPLSNAALAIIQENPGLIGNAVTGGDDYELLFSVRPDRVKPMLAEAAEQRIAVTEIGSVVDGSDVAIISQAGDRMEFECKSYDHFGGVR